MVLISALFFFFCLESTSLWLQLDIVIFCKVKAMRIFNIADDDSKHNERALSTETAQEEPWRFFIGIPLYHSFLNLSLIISTGLQSSREHDLLQCESFMLSSSIVKVRTVPASKVLNKTASRIRQRFWYSKSRVSGASI